MIIDIPDNLISSIRTSIRLQKNRLYNFYEEETEEIKHLKEAYEIFCKAYDEIEKQKESETIPFPLKPSDLVLFDSGEIRMVRKNNLCKISGLGIFSYSPCHNTYSCTEYVGNYDSNFETASGYFNIDKVITKSNPHYKEVHSLFKNGGRVPKIHFSDINADWDRRNLCKEAETNNDIEKE